MTDHSDLTYLREIAQSGERAPLLSGRFFVWWGTLAGIALIAHWAALTGRLPLEPNQVGFIWLVYGLVGMTGSFFLRKSLKNKPGAGSAGNRGDRAVWTAMAASILAYTLGTVFAFAMGRIDVAIFDTIPLLALSAYGIAFRTIGRLGGPDWMPLMAIFAWLAAGIGMFFVGTPAIYLFAAAATVVVALIPGFLLLSAEPAAINTAELEG